MRFLARYDPAVVRVARGALSRLRKRLRGANELVYDNYNALAIGWSSTERASDVICSIALYPRWVSLFFPRGAALSDPAGILKGSGKTYRHVVLADATTIDDRAVRELLDQAVDASAVPLGARRGRRIIKAIASKQRARRVH